MADDMIRQKVKKVSERMSEQLRKEDLQRLEAFRPIDDTFARQMFKGNPKLAERVLRIITQLADLEIDESGYDTQFDAKRLAGSRSLMLDVHGGDTKGRKYDLEMEKWDASPERAEYHIATMLVEHFHEGQKFSDLPETYVIFMCEHDKIGNGRAVNAYSYRNDDIFKENKEIESKIESYFPLGGKTHIFFVNGDYKDYKSDIGKLIHDFKCSQPKEMYFDDLAERSRHLKEDAEGVKEMCGQMENLRQQTYRLSKLEDILYLMYFMKCDVNKAMDVLHVDSDERSMYESSVDSALKEMDMTAPV